MKTKRKIVDPDTRGLQMCKGCLETEMKLNLVSNKKLKKSFISLSGLSVAAKSELFLCHECIRMATKFSDFQNMCCKADKIIKEYHKNIRSGLISEDITEHKKHLKLQQREIKNELNTSNTLTIDVCCIHDATHTRVISYSVEHNASDGSMKNYSEDMKILHRNDSIECIDHLDDKNNLNTDLVTDCNDLSTKVLNNPVEDVDIKQEGSPGDFFSDGYIVYNEDNGDIKKDERLEEFDNEIEKHQHIETCSNKILNNNAELSNSQSRDSNADDRRDKQQDNKSKPKTKQRKSRVLKTEKSNAVKLNITDRGAVVNVADNVKSNNFVCNICHKTYSTIRKLKVHRKIHTALQPHVCTQCHKTFRHKYRLETHMATHTGLRPVVCDQCGKSYSSVSTLRAHQMTHSAIKRFECQYCNKKFLRKIGLVTHIRTHTGEKNYVCDFCAKAFAIERNLVAHRRIHLGIRPYSCPICDKRFTESGTIKSHMRVHTGEKPFTCKFCDASFRTSTDVHCHEMIHTGVRPHKCDMCSYTARKSYHLKRHKLTHAKHAKKD